MDAAFAILFWTPAVAAFALWLLWRSEQRSRRYWEDMAVEAGQKACRWRQRAYDAEGELIRRSEVGRGWGPSARN